MEDTSGFYKWNEQLNDYHWAPNIVGGLHTDEPGVYLNLLREDKDKYTYPIQGWVWYDERPSDPINI